MALRGDGKHRVSLDKVIKTMRRELRRATMSRRSRPATPFATARSGKAW